MPVKGLLDNVFPTLSWYLRLGIIRTTSIIRHDYMRFSWSKIAVLSTIVVLSACGSGSNNNSKPLLDSGPVDVLFPLGHSGTTSDSVRVKGSITAGVESLTVNNISADFSLSDQYWFADVPVNAEGETSLSLQYEDANGIYDVSTGITLEKMGIYLRYISEQRAIEFGNKLYVVDASTDQLYSLNTDGSNIEVLWNYSDYNFEGISRFSIEDSLAISEDGLTLFMVIDGSDSASGEDSSLVASINTESGEVTTLYGPTTSGYRNFNTGHLIYMQSLGESGQLVMSSAGTNAVPAVFDIATNTVSEINIDALNDLTGGLVYTRIFSMSKKSDGVLRLIGNTRPNNTYNFWSAELDLTACDGEDATCRLQSSTLKTQVDFTGCDSPLNGTRFRDGTFHSASDRWIYSSDYQTLCALNLDDYTLSTATLSTDNDGYRNILSFTDNSVFLSLSAGFIQSASLPAVIDNATIQFSDFNSYPVIGDATLTPQVPREIQVNDSTNKAYWLDRDLGAVHQLDLSTWSWTTIFELEDEVLIDDQVATRPEFRPEESAIDESTNTLYVVSDNNESVFAIDLNTSEYQIVIEYDASADDQFDLYDIEAIAIDNTNNVLYLANQRTSDATVDGTTKFTLLAYDIESGELSEVSAPALITSNSLQENLKASYDMVFDSINDRVLFYYSDSIDPIWSVNINNGDREIVSFDYESDWTSQECLDEADADLCSKTDLIDQPSLSNARGHAIDIANNRLLISSQNSEAVLEMDLTSGLVKNISPENYSHGPILVSPKGIDLIGDSNVVLVSDESMDALFLVDTDSGQRVLLQHQ
jgi:predicted regulator of Ras-like GTPase activity (Roadblock/LC7/MglB family)